MRDTPSVCAGRRSVKASTPLRLDRPQRLLQQGAAEVAVVIAVAALAGGPGGRARGLAELVEAISPIVAPGVDSVNIDAVC